ncbi:hypothetical protein AC579_2827 [Pseudocercospora musae]|uniref:Uncharacterized protein n=1 Tax=Pseudocercospora musae TaxID=113226 RepID=A0A139IKL1_9PEZI|nr:hypothetical protein AC579_2827 [Pseudocercospora musae]
MCRGGARVRYRRGESAGGVLAAVWTVLQRSDELAMRRSAHDTSWTFYTSIETMASSTDWFLFPDTAMGKKWSEDTDWLLRKA